MMQDLEPYVCVFEGCADTKLFFADRATWLSHMKAHTTRWVCTRPEHRSSCTLPSEEAFEKHMRENHQGTFTDAQLPLLKSRGRIPASSTFSQCPLCGWKPTDSEMKKQILSMGWDELPSDEVDRLASESITRHLAAHLEALAVWSLPWEDVPEGAQSEVAESQHAQEGSEDNALANVPMHKSLSTLSFLATEEEGLVSSPEHLEQITEPSVPPDVLYDEDWSFLQRETYSGHDRDPVLQTLLRKLYLDTSSSSGSSQGPKLPAYLVPLEPGKNFHARSYALNAIQDMLCPDPGLEEQTFKPPSYPRCFTVYGPGGIGKTQVAAQFASTHRSSFDAVLWVYAENGNKIAQDFKDIAVALELIDEDHVDAKDLSLTRDILKRWLINPLKPAVPGRSGPREKASWLLVFDGVENGDVLNEFWPYDGPGSILVTSRNPHSWSTSLELKPFLTHEAADYLIQVTGRNVSDEEKAAATEIARRLGGLPLALSQMGSIISHRSISFGEFLRLYEGREGQQELLHWPLEPGRSRPSNYEQSIASVWAFDSLGEGTSLLNVLSMLDPDGIPENLFEHDGQVTKQPEIDELKRQYKDARRELLARSLVTGNKRDKKLFVHRLVQDVLRNRMSMSEMRQVFLKCVRLVSSKWPFEMFAWRHGNARWEACEELYPHVQRLKDLYPEIMPSPDSFEDYEFARLLIDAGW
jgi:hypothetical protein